jgi:hypothetical protein
MLMEYSHTRKVPIGLVCSTNQVNRFMGYTGFTTSSLADKIREFNKEFDEAQITLCRDHLGRDCRIDDAIRTAIDDAQEGVHIIHIDSDDIAFIDRIMHEVLKINPSVQFELGPGEGTTSTSARLLIEKMRRIVPFSLKDRVVYLAYPNGCRIKGIANTNPININVLRDVKALGFKLKGHNADYTCRDTLRLLAQHLDAINVAPQLGVIMTSAYMTFGRMIGDPDMMMWSEMVYESRSWHKWTDYERYAILAGGPYHLRRLPSSVRNVPACYNYVRDSVFMFIDHVMSFFPQEVTQ